MKHINEKSKIIILIIIVGIVMVLLFASIDYDTYAFMEYRAAYSGELDLDAIEVQLNNSGISYSRYTISYRENYSWNVTEFNFGKGFNNSNRNDTLCTIYEIEPYNIGYHVTVRLYCAENRKPQEIKPAINDSMNFVINIIHNATGKYPLRTYYFYEDGPALEYPTNYDYLTAKIIGGKIDI
jgi:hypothetical protein